MKKHFVFMAVITAIVLLSGCAKAPQLEINAAIASMDDAKTAQADIYLNSEFLALQDSFNVANAMVEEQNSKMFGNYKEPKAKMLSIAAQAADLAANAELKKEELRNEVFIAQAEIKQLMTENISWIEIVPKGKEGKEAIEAIKSDLTAINSSVDAVNTLLAGDQIMEAQTKAMATKQKANDINTELKTVMEKYGRK